MSLWQFEILHNDIYIIPIVDVSLLYSPLRRVAALVNRKAAALLKVQLQREGNDGDLPKSLQDLVLTLQTPVSVPPKRSRPLQPMFLGILPTRSCNLSCAYCDFGASSAPKGKMEYHTATAAVDWMADSAKNLGWETLEIHFFGGEPFVAGDVVDVVVHRVRNIANKKGLMPHFEVSTNGVFDEQRARWIGDYMDAVVLSFDGFQEIHDRHRGSFETVTRTAEILGHSPTELCLRACVSQQSVSKLEQIAQWFCENFQPSVINFETLQPTFGSEAAGLRPPDPYDFVAHYVRAGRIAESFGVKAIYASAVTDTSRYSFCPVGKDTLIMSPDGRISSCYLPQREWQKRGLDLDVGQLGSDGMMQIDLEAINRLRHTVMEKPRCEKCFCRWTCAGGCHVNQTYPGCSPEYNGFCIQTRIITACSLLRELGFDDVVDTLLDDRAAMETLSLQCSDSLIDL